MKDLIAQLMNEGINVEYEQDFDISKKSTIGIGGRAKTVFYPKKLKEFMMLADFFFDEDIPFLTLGNASNVLLPDGDFEKPIVFTTKLTSVEFSDGVFAEAGITSGAFLKECEKHGKTGAEFLAGIPCTLGGALYMNAGAGGKYISDIVKRVLVYKRKKLFIVPKASCGYAYKRSEFMNTDTVILGVELDLCDATPEEVIENKKNVLKQREWLPKGKSLGCIFKNPLGDFAGRLIENSGLKGLRVGGAVVSNEHANFIINDSDATAKDVIELIALVKATVFAQYKIELEEEIRIF